MPLVYLSQNVQTIVKGRITTLWSVKATGVKFLTWNTPFLPRTLYWVLFLEIFGLREGILLE